VVRHCRRARRPSLHALEAAPQAVPLADLHRLTDRQAVEEAVRTYLEEYAADRSPDSGKLDVRRLEVGQVDACRASAVLEASVRWAVGHPVHGLVQGTRDFSGPVELKLEDGAWRIVDLTVDGRRKSESVTTVSGPLEAGSLRIAALGLELGARVTVLEFVVESSGPNPLVVFEVKRGAPTLGVWTYLSVPLDLPVQVSPGERAQARAGWREVFALDTREFRFVVRAGEVDGPNRFDLHFALRRTPEPEAVLLGREPWLARLSSRRRWRLRLAPLGVFAVLLLLRWFRAAGIVLALDGLSYAVSIAYLWFVRRRGRPDHRLLLAVLGTIVVGVWLAWSGGSG
jgi:hypothetical protein